MPLTEPDFIHPPSPSVATPKTFFESNSRICGRFKKNATLGAIGLRQIPLTAKILATAGSKPQWYELRPAVGHVC